jgi:hypothetical protein
VIWFIDFVYVVTVLRELKRRRTFEKWWFKIKVVTHEIAILFYLTSLLIFSVLQDTSFSETKTAKVLEWSSIVAIVFAILAEITVMIFTIVEGICTAIKEFRAKKKKGQPVETSFDREMKKLEPQLDEGDIQRRHMTPR